MSLAAAIHCLETFDPGQVELADVADQLKEASQLKAIAEAAWFGIVARADELTAAHTFGYRTTAALIAAITGDRPGRARNDVEFTRVLTEAPAVAAPFSRGELTRPKVTEVLRAVGADEQKQTELVETAKTSSVKKLRDIVDVFLAEKGIEPAPIKNEATIKHGQGGGTLNVTLEPVRLNLLEIALDMAIAKMGMPKDLPHAERRAEALVAISKFFVEHIENSAHVRGSRPHVSVIVDIETLERRANRPARLENGRYITGEAARKMCCDAGITRIVSGPRSQPLDVGTATRSFPAPMAKAIIARDKHCVHPGCEAPPWACEIHHRQPVAAGGATSAENGELRCWFHHDLEHELDARYRKPASSPSKDRDHSDDACLAA